MSEGDLGKIGSPVLCGKGIWGKYETPEGDLGKIRNPVLFLKGICGKHEAQLYFWGGSEKNTKPSSIFEGDLRKNRNPSSISEGNLRKARNPVLNLQGFWEKYKAQFYVRRESGKIMQPSKTGRQKIGISSSGRSMQCSILTYFRPQREDL